jgi:hypothetical protein
VVSSAGETTSYNYSDSTITLKAYNEMRVLSRHLIYLLNGAGLIAMEKDLLLPGRVINYEYDADNRLVKSTGSTEEVKMENHFFYNTRGILDSNLLVYRYPDSETDEAAKIIFEYSQEKPNSITPENFGKPFEGKASVFLHDKETHFGVNSNKANAVKTLKYEFDKERRLVKEVITTESVKNSIFFTYY